MMNSKKAQINQVFVWIVVALVIGATALFGARSIGGILEDKCSTDLILFQDRILQTIQTNNNYGSITLKTLGMPCSYQTMCLVDQRSLGETIQFPGNHQTQNPNDIDPAHADLEPYFPVISSSVEDGVEQNVFLFNGKEIIPAGYIPQIRLNKDPNIVPAEPLCIKEKAGRISLILEGLGRNTYVKQDDQP